MKKFTRGFILVAAIAATSACTTAGPYVTSISSDGINTLNIDKCMVKLNPWTGTITNDSCTSSTVRLGAR